MGNIPLQCLHIRRNAVHIDRGIHLLLCILCHSRRSGHGRPVLHNILCRYVDVPGICRYISGLKSVSLLYYPNQGKVARRSLLHSYGLRVRSVFQACTAGKYLLLGSDHCVYRIYDELLYFLLQHEGLQALLASEHEAET